MSRHVEIIPINATEYGLRYVSPHVLIDGKGVVSFPRKIKDGDQYINIYVVFENQDEYNQAQFSSILATVTAMMVNCDVDPRTVKISGSTWEEVKRRG